ncbi:MAG TPA: hypothetical protein VHS59_07995 [Bacillota bacterium]|nr:hypothetical protein [Bacillota bacterium]
MLLTTEVVVALRCPMCGKFEQHQLSLFSFAGKKTLQISCDCGATKLILGTHNLQKFWLQIPCVLCETKHIYYHTRKQIWSGEVLTLTCADTKVDLAFIGSEAGVAPITEGFSQDITAFLEEIDPEDYINNPTIMMDVLNSLHDIAEDGYLFCECGNVKIDVDIMPDRLELHCPDCGAMGTVPAENEEDLKAIRSVALIELTTKGFDCLVGPEKTGAKGLLRGLARKRPNQHR